MVPVLMGFQQKTFGTMLGREKGGEAYVISHARYKSVTYWAMKKNDLCFNTIPEYRSTPMSFAD